MLQDLAEKMTMTELHLAVTVVFDFAFTAIAPLQIVGPPGSLDAGAAGVVGSAKVLSVSKLVLKLTRELRCSCCASCHTEPADNPVKTSCFAKLPVSKF